jgi:hypothetical protein
MHPQEVYNEDCITTPASKTHKIEQAVKMPILQRRNLSRLGEGQPTDQGHKGSYSQGGTLQMYKLSEDLSALSYGDNARTAK